jgi:hypothetical protein
MAHGSVCGHQRPAEAGTYVGIVTLIAMWMVMGYTVHNSSDAQTPYIFMTCIVICFRIFAIIPLFFWQRYRSGVPSFAWKNWDIKAMLKRTLIYNIPLCFGLGVFWYLSLPMVMCMHVCVCMSIVFIYACS